MGLDLRTSAANLRPYTGHLLRDGKSGAFQCRRCRRNLPDSEFEITDWIRRNRTTIAVLHPICNMCRKQMRSEYSRHPLVTPALHLYLHRLIIGAKAGARSRKITFALSDDDLLRQYIEQGGKCAMTGLRMAYGKRLDRATSRTAVSIDRIDSQRNYTVDNIQLVCRIVNTMKSDMSVEEFGSWCKAVLMHSLNHA